MAPVVLHSVSLQFPKASPQTLLCLKLEAAILVAPLPPPARPAAAHQALLRPPLQPLPLLLPPRLTARQPQPLVQARRHPLQEALPLPLLRPLNLLTLLTPRLLHQQLPNLLQLATVTHRMFSPKLRLAETAARRLLPLAAPRPHLPPAHPLPHPHCRLAR